MDTVKQVGCKNNGTGGGQPPNKNTAHQFGVTGRGSFLLTNVNTGM
jgi:hypothetical protein